jgi:hypothetical protein
LVDEVDGLDKEISDLVMTMVAKTDDKNTTIFDVQMMSIQWASKVCKITDYVK